MQEETAPQTSGTGNAAKPSIIHEKFLFDCDHLVNFCSKFEKCDITDQTDSILEIKLEDLENRWKKLQTDYENLMIAPESSNTRDFKENAKVNFNVCSEAYYETRSQILDVLRISSGVRTRSSFARQSVITASQEQTLSQFQQSHNSSDNADSYIKVPPCDTEVFKGGYEEWPSFRDMFTAVYVNHPKLTRAQKLYHLRNKTRGSAGTIVKRFSLCDENFELAWNALKTRYENKRVLVDNQLKILFSIPVATVESSESLQRIHSTVNDSISTLKTLEVKIESWDPLLIYLISTKLPDETLSLWEQSLKSHRDLPTWNQMDEFLTNRFEVVERISSIRVTKDRYSLPTVNASQSQNKIQTYSSQEKLNGSCPLCKRNHSIRICQEFRRFSVQERIDFVYKNKLCNNCLSESHLKQKCKSKGTCIACKKHHHTLLHLKTNTSGSNNAKHEENSEKYSSNNIASMDIIKRPEHDLPSTSQEHSSQVQANFSCNNDTILLRTALVQVEHEGELFMIRALIDPGSQRTFISERVRSRLHIPYFRSYFEIVGIGGKTQSADKECSLVLRSPKNDFKCTINAIVLPKLTKRLPSVSFNICDSNGLQELELADPHFNKSSNIDIILGNDSERFINLEGIKKDICGNASAYNTVFGWVLCGPVQSNTVHTFSTNVISSEDDKLNAILRKFWESEEIPDIPSISPEDKFCQEFYSETTTRQSDGRYVVRLPFKKDFPSSIYLGSSRFIALGQYARMEKTLCKDKDLQDEYNSVLNEYIAMNHMEETSPYEKMNNGKHYSFYLPHHAVVRPDHKSTKVRVVFNASRKSKSGVSLNDVLHTGPTLQTELISTILSWRKYKYVYSGDIQKMYRQIILHPNDRPFQRILYQPNPNGPIKDYQLNRVTFGVNCAPFLAIRTLLQLASDSEDQYPQVASILRRETYVDDILSGGFSIKDTTTSLTNLITVLNSAGFPLKKITANDSSILSHLPPEDLYDLDLLRFCEASSTKTLGLKWNALRDAFCYSPISVERQPAATKRQVLSTVAKLFDPVGWIAPVTIKAKLLMQQLWLEGSGWDETISSDSLLIWNNLLTDLPHIESIAIPRWIQTMPEDLLEIHGFCDASKGAYCACVYIRCQTPNATVFTNLLIAKSKVNPLKPVSLPKLELTGAVLLSKLVKYVLNVFDFNVSSVTLWTDASIVLGWLSKPPWSWDTFVANRTGQIHDTIPFAKWRHVPTHDNPADIGTRGCKPQDLTSNSLWWHGPSWLTRPESSWPKRNPLMPTHQTQPVPNQQASGTEVNNITSSREIHIVDSLLTTSQEDDILKRFSSYSRAIKVLSYVFRFFHKIHKKFKTDYKFDSVELSLKELNFVKARLICLSQQRFYQREYEELKGSMNIFQKSALKPLNPFLDSDNIMRVNGRLSDSSLPYRERYPIILPGNSRLCYLYLSHLHTFLAHAECNLMCRFVQTEFFVSHLKSRVKSIIYKCKVCILYKQKICKQIMAPLPPERCTFTPPFHITGVDFAGPFELKSSNLRNSPTLKGYASVFVCFTTKAVHLEACSELSAAAFEAAFSRFVGRRGLPHRIVSDNGRNFLGASRTLLREFTKFLKSTSSDITQKYSIHGFEWKFIPPHAPHMGGLWEAAVKSFKIHFKKIAGAHKFTFEQFSTLLARIEGLLNSRPISAISEDPLDLTALTPGHFLKGSPIMALPEPVSPNGSLINKWLKLKALHHQFAQRWKADYLKALHKRYKWQNITTNLKPGDLVVIVDDLVPPSEWRLGRVEKTYAGSDKNVRVADIRTATGIINRPIVKLCYLPYSTDSEHTL